METLERLIDCTIDELRILDNNFARSFQSLSRGKFGLLSDAQMLLMDGRLPLAETGPDQFPEGADKVCRTLWFSDAEPPEDRNQVEIDLYGWNGKSKAVVDINYYDGEAFFRELAGYFEAHDPMRRLAELEEANERLRTTLLEYFSIEDVLTDIAEVARYPRTLR